MWVVWVGAGARWQADRDAMVFKGGIEKRIRGGFGEETGGREAGCKASLCFCSETSLCKRDGGKMNSNLNLGACVCLAFGGSELRGSGAP